jgi:protein-L-isoaspartate(D-aspartate) O-methyltransferase
MTELDRRRRFFAEEIEAVVKIRSGALVDAFATVPREQFLRPGPWTVLSDTPDTIMMGAATGVHTTTTPDADPARVYHNIVVAIDSGRQLFNGQPGTLGVWIDRLDVARGARVLHVGAGLGYYTAVLAECVGSGGRVVAYEADGDLAAEAQRNLASRRWVELRHGDASGPVDGPYDAILINAGVTHPLDAWLDALAPSGRMMVPITTTMPAMGSTLGKGVVMAVAREADGTYSVRIATLVAVYSAIGIRDDSLSERIGKALMGGPQRWQAVRELRRDPHEPTDSCWLHLPSCCFSARAREREGEIRRPVLS